MGGGPGEQISLVLFLRSFHPIRPPEGTGHHLALAVATMHLSTAETVELGLMEQGTINPAFGVSWLNVLLQLIEVMMIVVVRLNLTGLVV